VTDDLTNSSVAAEIVADLVRRPEVADRWEQESACAGMTVGGLANHLGAQVVLLVRLLEAGPSVEHPITVDEHYARAAWTREDLAGEANVAIREGSDEEARDGQGALVERVEAAMTRLPGVVRSVAPETPVLIPWQGWALTAHDLLTTRMMEMVVHADDLAASVDVDTPEFPDEVAERVIALLTRVAVRRHGQASVVRALSRPQRAPASVSAF
jgi:Mycothiol maleylpyruvate isomerase N-terminal domain